MTRIVAYAFLALIIYMIVTYVRTGGLPFLG